MRDRREAHRIHEQAHLAQVGGDVESVAHRTATRRVAMIRDLHRLQRGIGPPRANLTHRRGRICRIRTQPGHQRRGELVQHLGSEGRIRRSRRRIAERGTASPRRGKLLLLDQAERKQTLEGLAHARHVQAGLLGQFCDSDGARVVRNALQESVLRGCQGSHRGECFSQGPRTGGVIHR